MNNPEFGRSAFRQKIVELGNTFHEVIVNASNKEIFMKVALLGSLVAIAGNVLNVEMTLPIVDAKANVEYIGNTISLTGVVSEIGVMIVAALRNSHESLKNNKLPYPIDKNFIIRKAAYYTAFTALNIINRNII